MIFKNFPENPDCYSEDMRPMVSKTIERHGLQEWRAGVLTNELHGHLGVYAIIGVKMGIFALDKLEIEAGNIKIISLAGMNPPVSCLNDGLQVSTSATFGHGLISSQPTENPSPEATFATDSKQIHIKMKDSVLKEVANEISEAVNRWGHSAEYWDYVRTLAIRYWYELDRNEIFDIIFQ